MAYIDCFDCYQKSCPLAGLLGELSNLLFRDLSLLDLYDAYQGQGQRLNRLRGPLRRFARSNILQDGSPSDENLTAAVDRLISSVRGQLERTVVGLMLFSTR